MANSFSFSFIKCMTGQTMVVRVRENSDFMEFELDGKFQSKVALDEVESLINTLVRTTKTMEAMAMSGLSIEEIEQHIFAIKFVNKFFVKFG